ncbi:MAG TPA: hypothetical protein VHE14_03075 [Solirubrobacteraceae bacterium]|nr:hypothetical protein [Solirubrobacteraceae bacterium]
MVCACIDIGSNTTRLLVAEPNGTGLRTIHEERAFTRIGRGLGCGGEIGQDKIAEVAGVVAEQVRVARELGSTIVHAVATAAIRRAPNGAQLGGAVNQVCGVELEVLSGEAEARLAFVGATHRLTDRADCRIAVVDVGGGSSEIAIGTRAGGVEWSVSLPLGSGALAEEFLTGDPPTALELDAVRARVSSGFDQVELPGCDRALAVGGSAGSLPRLAGSLLDADAVDHTLALLSSGPSWELAEAHELDPRRVRLLPAGVLIFAEACTRLRRPLEIGRGGVREGVLLERLERLA